MPKTVLAVVLTLAALTAPLTATADAMTEPIDYTVRFPERATHRVEVEARYPVPAGAGAVDLMMAVWTPGSYLVREYARQVETLAASTPGGRELSAEKVAKNRWRVATGGGETVVVRYRLYAREMSVRTNFVDAGFAILNGAPTFLTLVEGDGPARRPHRVRVELPEGWSHAVSPLPGGDGGRGEGDSAAPVFVAPDFPTLVDSPLYAGNPEIRTLAVEGAEIVLVHEGTGGLWDFDRASRAAEAVAREQIALWGTVPFDRYVVFNLATEGRGGLEHLDSTVLMTSRFKDRTEEGWHDWVTLLSHELFHAWNGKRLRPVELGPFDFERENLTRGLWFVEGFTSYYDELIAARAGLLPEADYLKRLGETVEAVGRTPGRLVQPLDESSYDAWIKYYRRDENSANHDVSYYQKGGLVAWLLDARIRRATGGERTLDDLMREAWRRWSGERGSTQEELFALAGEIGGSEVAAWLEEAVTTAGELDFAPALEQFGLRRGAKETAGQEAGEGGGEPDQRRAWLGAETAVTEGRLVVRSVRRGTPAFAAGLNAEDEILAFDDYRVPPTALDKRLEAYRPGDEVALLVARRERLLRLPVTLGAKPKETKLAVDPKATDEQQARRRDWLAAAAPTPASD
ncbi:MAG TPA: PDZ domain-containing protein [Thermoanaerobaculia bacterium]|nr:PDZ domain-containing protein [Thermoanaerobaculia bacterium]